MSFYFLHQPLQQSAQRTPAADALRWKGQVYTYEQVDSVSNHFANQLLDGGVKKGDRVCLYLEKSPTAVASIYGILKTGAAYVPLDVRSPMKRISHMLRDCAAKGLITNAQGLARLNLDEEFVNFKEATGLVVILAEDQLSVDGVRYRLNKEADIREDDLAYILYTSGSTGQPKGVMLSHRAGLSFANWGAEYFQLSARDKVSSHAPFHFDLSIFDLFSSAIAGACVCLIPSEVMIFPPTLAEWIAQERISVWYSAPTALTQLVLYGGLENLRLPDLRHILFAGEVFPIKYLKRLQALLPDAACHNLYGPSETNVCTVWSVPQLAPEQESEIPIGKACADLEVFALNENGQLAGVHEAGELYVYGPGVMLGYWGMPQKTEAVLGAHPLRPERPGKTYRTGDLVRLESDSNYYFLGRRDHQIKSRGYRIQLGEIEAALLNHPDIIEAVAIAVPHTENGNLIHAHVVLPAEKAFDPKELAAFCRKVLPAYMVPAEFHREETLPKTSTGKVDRTRLAPK